MKLLFTLALCTVSMTACSHSAIPATDDRATGDTTAREYSILYQFPSLPGAEDPKGPMLFENELLYGTTESGGAEFNGTIFLLTLSGKEKILYSFRGPYAATGSDGAIPTGGLVVRGDMFYGMTLAGGADYQSCAYGCGTLYSITPSGNEHVVYSFKGSPDGAMPNALIGNAQGEFFGTSTLGGKGHARGECSSEGCGTVFKIDNSGKEHVLYSFRGGNDGSEPLGVIDLNGMLYGTTVDGGGPCECGTVYALPATGGEKRIVYRFSDKGDGEFPEPLTLAGDALYGAAQGGKFGAGVIFRFASTGQEHVIYNFTGKGDGGQPLYLTYYNKRLFGTTREGGLDGHGTLFVSTLDGTLTTLYSLNGNDGVGPNQLVPAQGLLYGTMTQGGKKNAGLAFNLRP